MAIFSAKSITRRQRLRLAAVLMVVFMALIIGRLGYLQIFRHDYYALKAVGEHTRSYEIPATRGEIYVHDDDSGQVPIVLNQTLNILWANPRYVSDPAETAAKLAAVIGGDLNVYKSKLSQNKLQYVLLAQKVSNELADKIKDLGLSGVGLSKQDYRT